MLWNSSSVDRGRSHHAQMIWKEIWERFEVIHARIVSDIVTHGTDYIKMSDLYYSTVL